MCIQGALLSVRNSFNSLSRQLQILSVPYGLCRYLDSISEVPNFFYFLFSCTAIYDAFDGIFLGDCGTFSKNLCDIFKITLKSVDNNVYIVYEFNNNLHFGDSRTGYILCIFVIRYTGFTTYSNSRIQLQGSIFIKHIYYSLFAVRDNSGRFINNKSITLKICKPKRSY